MRHPLNLAVLSSASWLPASYRTFVTSLPRLSDPELKATMRDWFRKDLWALLTVALSRPDLIHPWLYQRCQEIQTAPDGYLDLWARGHYKSTIITYGKTIQDILASHGDDPLSEWGGLEPTFCIFSHTRPIAKAFLRQIKVELARNATLKELFPDVLYEAPDRQAPRWSEDTGLVVRRKSNPKESTVEAWGLVDGQPTSKHFSVLLYDDVVTRDSVTTPDMIKKTTDAWELSLNLGDQEPRKRYIGTRYHFADTYRTIKDRGAAIERKHPATVDGTLKGEPVLLTKSQLETKIAEMGPYTASAQLMQNPIADSKQTFAREWLQRRFDRETVQHSGMRRALICDPASGKKGSDFTAMAVIGLGEDRNVYLLDFLRDRLNLKQRATEYLRLHRKWKPHKSAYEEYGLQADIEYIETIQVEQTYRFEIEKLGGKLGKIDRVNRLIPIACDGHLYLPETLYRTNTEGKVEDLIDVLIEQEFLAWPVPVHDDGLDVISRYQDVEDFDFPEPTVEPVKDDRYNRPRRRGGWMSA